MSCISVKAYTQSENKIWLLINRMCVNNMQQILHAEFKWDKYFVDEVETQLKEKPLQGSQIQNFHYS